VTGRILLFVGATLLGCSDPDSTGQRQDGLDFDALATEHPLAAPEETFQARDGAPLSFRSYPGGAPISLILIHGSGAQGIYLSGLAAAIASAGLADVYTPDLRGHGSDPERRGDIDYIDQLEDDLADFISLLRRRDPDTTVVLGGHSSGGGLAIRVAGSEIEDRPDAYLLLAPFLQHNAPTVRPQSGGWAHPSLGKIVAISILNGFGMTTFNDATVLKFDLPESRRSGLETLSYSYRMMTGFAPRDYRLDLETLCEPTLVIVGTDDEAFYADRFVPVFSELAPQVRVELLPGVGHLGLASSPATRDVVMNWLRELAAGQVTSRCAEGSQARTSREERARLRG